MIFSILGTAVVLVAVPKVAQWTGELISRVLPDNKSFGPQQKKKTQLFLGLLYGIIGLVLIAWLWGLNWGRLLVVSSSLFAVVGVALFASWSLLSNITSFFVLLTQGNLFHGARVRVIDGANHVEGVITEMGLFHFELTNDHNNVIVYPNNVLMTRPIMVMYYPEPKLEPEAPVVDEVKL